MSHKSIVDTKMKNKNSILKALNKLGITYKEGNLKTKGNYGVNENVDILLEDYKGVNLNNAVGLKKDEKGNYKMIGDFYGLRDNNNNRLDETEFSERITNAYNYEELNPKLGNIGFNGIGIPDLSLNKVSYVMQRIV